MNKKIFDLRKIMSREIKSDNLKELVLSLKDVHSDFNSNFENTAKMLEMLGEEIYKTYCINLKMFYLLKEKLQEVYGVSINVDSLLSEASDFVDVVWPELKKRIRNNIDNADFQKIVESFDKEVQ